MTGSSDSCKLSFVVLNLRGTFDMRYDIHGDALSMSFPFSVFMAEIYSARISDLYFVGHSAKPVLVGRVLARNVPLGPNFDLRRV